MTALHPSNRLKCLSDPELPHRTCAFAVTHIWVIASLNRGFPSCSTDDLFLACGWIGVTLGLEFVLCFGQELFSRFGIGSSGCDRRQVRQTCCLAPQNGPRQAVLFFEIGFVSQIPRMPDQRPGLLRSAKWRLAACLRNWLHFAKNRKCQPKRPRIGFVP